MIKNKKILIVGGTGFLGFNLAKKFIKDNLVTSISTRNPHKDRSVKGVKYITLDISNKDKFNKIKKYSFNYVINLAGYVNHKDKINVYKSHYIGTKNLISYFKKKKIDFFLQIGSCTEYGHLKSPQKEKSNLKLLNLKSFYSKAKLKASKYLLNEIKNKKINGLIVRPYLIYGPYQDYNRLIPIVFKNCILDKNFNCSDGEQIRNFLYIDDFVEAIAKVLKTKPTCKIMNIGSRKSYKVKTIIKRIKSITNKGKPLFGMIKLRLDEPKIIYPNLNNLNKYINWREKVNLNLGLKKTYLYFKKNVGKTTS